MTIRQHTVRAFARPFPALWLAAALCALWFAPGTRAETTDQPPLYIAQDHTWAPLAFENEQGEPAGLLVDLWREIGRELGREVRFELVDWNDSLRLVRDRPNRIHGGLFESPERNAYLDFSSDLMTLRTTLFAEHAPGQVTPMVPEDLGDTPVGVTAGGYEEEFLREHYPGLTLELYRNNRKLVQSAARGNLQAFAADYPVGMYYLDRFTTPEHFYVMEVLYEQPLHAAVAKGNSALLTEVERGLAALSDERLANITQKWMQSERVETLPDWLGPVLLLVIAVALVGGMALHNRDLKRRLARQAARLEHQLERQRLLTENMTDFIWTVDEHSRLSYVSPSVERMLGYQPEDMVDQEMTWALTPESAADTYALQQRLVEAARRGEYEGYVDTTAELAQRHRNGHTVWTEVVIRCFFTPQGEFAGAQGASRDITERVQAEKTLRHLASVDNLTQLPNRRLLLDRLQQAITRCRKRGQSGALLYMDLDNFKQFNDYQGHIAGDRLLKQIARRLSHHLPEGVTLGRYSGDGFMLVAPELGRDLETVIERTRALAQQYLDLLSREFDLDGAPCRLSSSMGVALIDGEELSAERLIQHANRAMHRAKSGGRNRFEIWRGDD